MNAEQVLFALIRSVICGETATEQVKNACTPELLEAVCALAAKHDLAHLAGQALSKLSLPESEPLKKMKAAAMQAVTRYIRLEHEYQHLCATLETAQIPFVPLKGAVLRQYYPELWMRTSCDVDILVHPEDLDRATAVLTEKLSYEKVGSTPHDVTLQSPGGVHMELHFDLVEEGRVNGVHRVLQTVWEHVSPVEGKQYQQEMTDGFFYFYHIAHMAKHFETGGCGIRPLIDLWLLDRLPNADEAGRSNLLEQGRLVKFAQGVAQLSRVWLSGEAQNDLTSAMETFLLQGGSFGTVDNRVALRKTGPKGRLGYLRSRVFVPYEKLKGYYPVLEKHPWLMPVMQVRRWFMLLDPKVAAMAKHEMSASANQDKKETVQAAQLLAQLEIDPTTW